MPRFLAIDLGSKRTGLALGDDETHSAGPVGTIETADPAQRLTLLARAIDDHAPDALVLGIPYNADGTTGPAADAALAFAATLRERFGLPVHTHDERLTSFAADQQMSQSGLTRAGKKARRDALAAAALLTDFLETRRSTT